MRKFTHFHLSFLVLCLVTLACVVPTTPASTGPTQAIDLNTVIAQTAAVAMSQTALVSPPDLQTFTPEVTLTASHTPTGTPTATLFFTPTPEVAMITVSVATNCRNGPGKVYVYEGALLIGDMTEVFARDPTGEYWYVRNPDFSGAEYCWLWGKYATITGNTSMLPIYTPPPTPTATNTPLPTLTGTPTPSFVFSHSGLDTCTGTWWIEVKIRNNGTVTFKSLDLVVRDMATNITLEDLANGFKDNDGCNTTTTKDVLLAGETYLVSALPFNYDPSGHKLKVVLTLCSETGQKGICLKQNLDIDL